MADDIDWAGPLGNMIRPQRAAGGVPVPRPRPLTRQIDDYTEDLTPSETKLLYDAKAYNDPTLSPGWAFAKAGRVPKMGELPGAPSLNIEDRRGQFGPVDQNQPTIDERVAVYHKMQGLWDQYKDSPLVNQLMGPSDLHLHHIRHLMELAKEPVSLPRSRPKDTSR
jgi:hypothetical protein